MSSPVLSNRGKNLFERKASGMHYNNCKSCSQVDAVVEGRYDSRIPVTLPVGASLKFNFKVHSGARALARQRITIAKEIW